MSERNEFPCETSTDFVAVRRYAVEWLKTHYPALTVKAGLCESIGGRLYTRTVLTTHPLAAAVLQQEAGEPVAWQYLSDHEGWKFVCNERRDVLKRARYQIRPLYATPQVSPPQARVPLTMNQVWANDEIMSLNAEIGFPMPFLMRTVRAIERAHLIGLETKE